MNIAELKQQIGQLGIPTRPVESLIPYIRNARTHSEAQVGQIAASVLEFGWTNPILIDPGKGIIAGHGRLLAAKKLGLDAVPVLELSHLTEAQKRAYIIADNKLAELAGWDNELLKVELGWLQEQDFNLGLTGFGEEELSKLFADRTQGHTDPDDVPPVPNDPVAERGDVWILGNHRLICGDATSADDVAKVLAGVKPMLMVTDPPYGVNYDPSWRDKVDGVWTSSRATGKVDNDDKADWTEAWALFPGDVAYVWHASLHTAEVMASLEKAGFIARANIIWVKQHFVFSQGHYHWQHEPCWYAVKKNGKAHWAGDRKQTTVWQIENASAMGGKKDDTTTGHGTQKPVECMRRPIENNSSPGQAVYEPFSGSGTTIIACEMTGRSCHAIELNPAYVDVAILRWQEFTRQTAVLESNGLTFNEVMAARHPDKPILTAQEHEESPRGSSKGSKKKKG